MEKEGAQVHGNGTLSVTRIQRFSTQDGSGIRTTVFLQGCPLHCAWCHNPETQSLRPVLIWTPQDCVGCGGCATVCPTGARRLCKTPDGAALVYGREACAACGACAGVCPTGACELSAKDMTVGEIVSTVLRDRAFFGESGGVTLSGGEPLMQAAVIELMTACRQAGLSVAVETAGAVSAGRMKAAAPLGDQFLYDLKDTDAERLNRMTGGDLGHILGNLRVCDENLSPGGRIRLRCILVKGVNTEVAHYRRVAEVYASLRHCEGVELIPYHAYAGSKAECIGLPDNGRRDWIPTEADLHEAKAALEAAYVPLIGL